MCVRLRACDGSRSFSTDDDNDTEVEAVDADTELSLVTECWVEPQSGTVCSRYTQQHAAYQGLPYQDIPKAVSTTSNNMDPLRRGTLDILWGRNL